MFAGGEDLAGAIEQVAVLGARLLLQAAIEAEVTAYLGRDRYERTASCEDARAGMRNGYCPTTVIILSRESDHAFDQGFSDEGRAPTLTNVTVPRGISTIAPRTLISPPDNANGR